jgi:hypothetical protein
MSTPGTFWFIFWRMALWGPGLGAAYGTSFFSFGLVFGPLLGAISGLPA